MDKQLLDIGVFAVREAFRVGDDAHGVHASGDQRLGQMVAPVARLPRDLQDALTGLCGDTDPFAPTEDIRDRRARDSGLPGDLLTGQFFNLVPTSKRHRPFPVVFRVRVGKSVKRVVTAEINIRLIWLQPSPTDSL